MEDRSSNRVIVMGRYKYIIAFVLCWFTSTGTLYSLNIIWPTDGDTSIRGLITRTFGISIAITIVLVVALNKEKQPSKA